jgi:drug/metabolite transporter (DMT)-like permease
MNQRKAWIMLILCNLFWAGNYVFGQFVVGEMSPLMLTFIRWFFATMILLVIAVRFEKPEWRKVLKAWPVLMAMGFSGIIIYNLALYTALMHTSSTNAAVVSAMNPALLVVLSAFLLREKLSRLQSVGIIVSFTGVLIIITGGSLAHLLMLQLNRGDLLMLIAIAVWTIYSILSKRLSQIPPITATAVSALIATILLGPFALAQGFTPGELSGMAVTGIIYIILFPSVGSFIFWNLSVREIGAGKAGVFLNLIPVFTALISLALGEPVTWVQLTGGLFVFAGVYMTTGLFEKRIRMIRQNRNHSNNSRN